jgi:DNA-binding HxlR family transcriptional regulator/putative sterol carrier protein
VASRGYGQYCGLARALELVGERWALLIIRDLLVGPRRFTDLRKGLPRIPSNVLSDRLKELEADGIVQRRVLPRPASATVYELTAYGAQLEDAVMRLGIWGAQSLGEPRPGEIMTPDSMTIALRSTFVPAAARSQQMTYELRIGPIVLNAGIDDGKLQVAEGPAPRADLVIEAQSALKRLFEGTLTPDEALQSGQVRIQGDPTLLDAFVTLFHIPSHRETQQV